MTEKKTRAPRATRKEMIERKKAEIARLEALEAGMPDTTTEEGVLKSLKRQLRKSRTALKAAKVTLYGDDTGEVKRTSIDERIAKTQERLDNQNETKARAQSHEAALPNDIKRLEGLIEAAESGEDIEFPTDLTPLGKPKSDEEHEAMFIANAADQGDDD